MMEFDSRNGNSNWMDADSIELIQIEEYEILQYLVYKGREPQGHKKITIHFVYDIKYDGHHKDRLVAGGHLIETTMDRVYSSGVSLCGLRI